jgi:hypothetical protein
LSWAHAPASISDKDQSALASLQAKVNQADPRDQCILYARLIHRMTDLAGQQFESGDTGAVSETLKQVQRYLENIHANATGDSRKIKDAELLVRQSSSRLNNLLRETSFEDRIVVEVTLRQLSQVQEQLMMLVFTK